MYGPLARLVLLSGLGAGLLHPGAAPAADPFADLVRGATAREGFFDTYEKGDHLYLAVPPARLGRDMLLAPRLDRGVGARSLFGGLLFDRPTTALVAFERHGDRLFLVRRADRFTAVPGSAGAAAVALSFGDSVLQSAPVLATRPDGAAVVDVYDWFVADLANLDRILRQGFGSSPAHVGPAAFDRSRSWLAGVKAFPQNLDVRVQLTFAPAAAPAGFSSVADSRFVPVAVRYSFAALPETPLETRPADDRIGAYFLARKDFSATERDTPFVRPVKRWRLEAGEKAGDLWRPKQPIVYALDRSIPERWRPWIKQGIEAWNRAFEAAGFKDAIRAEDLPAGADPDDLRQHAILWVTNDQPQFAGLGQSVVDPRTGEILSAGVLLESASVLQYRSIWKLLVSPAARFRTAPAPGDPTDDELIGQGLRWVTMHEIGHTLGLDHNFRASASTPFERIHDRARTREHGIAASVMDYVPLNIPPLGQELGDLFDAGVGPYDLWAISFLYTPDPERARRLARLGAQPGHDFGMEEDADAPGAVDPLLARDDMTSDPVAWARERAALYHALFRRLPALALHDDDGYDKLTTAFQAFLYGTAGLLAPAVRTLGGQLQSHDHLGDPGARPPFAPVPRPRQEEALAWIIEEAFGAAPFGVDPALLSQLGAPAWAHWGVKATFDGRVDIPYVEEIEGIQRRLLAELTDPYRLASIHDAEVKYGAAEVLPLTLLFDRLTREIWKEEWTAPGAGVPVLRRGLQRAWIDRLMTLLVKPPDHTPGDARALARRALRDVHDRLVLRLAHPARFDAATRAHLLDMKERIEKALGAKVPAAEPR